MLVYSRYGHGGSDKLPEKRPVEFMHHEGEVVLPELLDKLDISRPIVLGHSDGGSIALIFAGKYPERPRALILEAPHVFVEDLSVASITFAKDQFQTTSFAPSSPAITNTWMRRSGDGTTSGSIRSFAHGTSNRICRRFAVPFCAFRAKRMSTARSRRCRAIEARMPATEIVMLANCKHSPHRDQPEATLERMVEFVREEEAEKVTAATGSAIAQPRAQAT